MEGLLEPPPAFTAELLFESTCMERLGPPRILIEELPVTEIDELAVLCSSTSGTGVSTGFKPQPAEAETGKVPAAETSFVNV
jgi:hypothetical protein